MIDPWTYLLKGSSQVLSGKCQRSLFQVSLANDEGAMFATPFFFRADVQGIIQRTNSFQCAIHFASRTRQQASFHDCRYQTDDLPNDNDTQNGYDRLMPHKAHLTKSRLAGSSRNEKSFKRLAIGLRQFVPYKDMDFRIGSISRVALPHRADALDASNTRVLLP